MDIMSVLSHFDDTKTAFSYKSNYELKRAYILFKLLSYPSLAFIGKHLLNLLIKIHFPINNLIKQTIFEQFCGGENEKECFKVINKLNENNIRCILNYSIEGSNTESNYEHTLNKTLNLIDLSEKQYVSPFIVFKPSSVGRFDLYLKKANNDSLNENEIDEWQRVEQRYDQICNSAAKSGVSILIDAEESWIQKPVDELIEKLMIKYNNSSCIVYNTIQTYRIDRFEYLSDLYKRLSKSNIKIGIKLVRGAYMEKERIRAKSNNYKSPICETKLKTDENYNNCMSFIFSNINDFNLFIGSHNERSNLLATEIMEKHQIKNNDKRVWFGQLYGMSDNISFNLALNRYNVTKYLPFGPIKEVIPYLIRRLDENTSVSGQTSRELKLISKEIKRRRLESNN